ncbi:MAG: hypothetical protein M3008_12015 [Chloroflexota bacterium]|nr:hypothetical protein [Chloroflexota bacterium]
MKVPGIGWVRARGGRVIATSMTSGRFFRDRAGDWLAARRYIVAVPDTALRDVAALSKIVHAVVAILVLETYPLKLLAELSGVGAK